MSALRATVMPPLKELSDEYRNEDDRRRRLPDRHQHRYRMGVVMSDAFTRHPPKFNEEIKPSSMSDADLGEEINKLNLHVNDISRQLDDNLAEADQRDIEVAKWRNRAGNARRIFNRRIDELRIEAQKRGLHELLMTPEQQASLMVAKAREAARIEAERQREEIKLEAERQKEEIKRIKAERHAKFLAGGSERKKEKAMQHATRCEFFVEAAYELMEHSDVNKIWEYARMKNLSHPAFSSSTLEAKDG